MEDGDVGLEGAREGPMFLQEQQIEPAYATTLPSSPCPTPQQVSRNALPVFQSIEEWRATG